MDYISTIRYRLDRRIRDLDRQLNARGERIALLEAEVQNWKIKHDKVAKALDSLVRTNINYMQINNLGNPYDHPDIKNALESLK